VTQPDFVNCDTGFLEQNLLPFGLSIALYIAANSCHRDICPTLLGESVA
jgi:hypothetical protein